MNCEHIFGMILPKSKDAPLPHFLHSRKEIQEKKDYFWQYPNAPQYLYVFKYCPKCGFNLNDL